MKSLYLLRACVDLAFFLSALGLIAILIVLPIKLINPDSDIPITIKNIEIIGNDWLSLLVVVFSAIGAVVFVYALFILRRVIGLFLNREVFSDRVIQNFKIIGRCIISSAVLTSVPMFFYNMIRHNNLGIEFNGGGFDSLLLSVSLGLLFIVIATIFQTAKNLKEENELTV